ncbi:MAG: lipoprotein-releasing ABC transporter permease subunit [Alphaproteobacteria bacterium]|nr:lipoprotein-releasing ABC transporter permease subunit [Alphaproteobacteria bacterium]
MAAVPFSSVEWLLAGRYLRTKKQESFVNVIAGFSFVGIALGVAVLIIVMAVMNGFRIELLSRVLGINGHMRIDSLTGGFEDYDAEAAKILAVPGVVRAAPMVQGQVLASANGVQSGALVRGLTRENLLNLPLVAKGLEPQGAADAFEGSMVILGARLAQQLGLGPGMRVTLLSPEGDVTVMGRAPRKKTYVVAGIFEVGMIEYDSSFIYMPLKEAQLFFGRGNKTDSIEVMINDPDTVENWREPVRLASPPNARLYDWKQINAAFFDALIVERNVMFLILSLVILVAALNTISGLIMLVKDKGRDIAILRTMGMSQWGVMRVFFIAGSAIGFVGTILGLILGVLFCLNIEEIRQFMSWLSGTQLFSPEIYFLSKMPAQMEVDEVIAVAVMSLTLAFIATLYPSWRAARLDPVEALRYE